MHHRWDTYFVCIDNWPRLGLSQLAHLQFPAAKVYEYSRIVFGWYSSIYNSRSLKVFAHSYITSLPNTNNLLIFYPLMRHKQVLWLQIIEHLTVMVMKVYCTLQNWSLTTWWVLCHTQETAFMVGGGSYSSVGNTNWIFKAPTPHSWWQIILSSRMLCNQLHDRKNYHWLDSLMSSFMVSHWSFWLV